MNQLNLHTEPLPPCPTRELPPIRLPGGYETAWIGGSRAERRPQLLDPCPPDRERREDHCRTLMARARGRRNLPAARCPVRREGQYRRCRVCRRRPHVPAFSYTPARSARKRRTPDRGRRHLHRQDQSRSTRHRPLRRALALRLLRQSSQTRAMSRAAPVPARRSRSPPATSRSRLAPIPAARAAFPPGSTTSSASSRRSGWCRRAAWCRTARRWIASRSSAIRYRTAQRSSDVIEGFDPEDPYSRPAPASVSAARQRHVQVRPPRCGKDLECFGMPECGALYEQRLRQRFAASRRHGGRDRLCAVRRGRRDDVQPAPGSRNGAPRSSQR